MRKINKTKEYGRVNKFPKSLSLNLKKMLKRVLMQIRLYVYFLKKHN